MTNLIPPIAKKDVIREYWKRVAAVWTLLAIAAVMVSGALLYPTVVLIEGQMDTVSDKYAQVKDQAHALDVVKEELQDDITRAQLLMKDADSMPVSHSELIEELTKLSGDGVQIERFSHLNTGENSEQLTIRGLAATRQSLTTFLSSIEEHPFFTSTDYSLSDLSKSANIDFSINVFIASNDGA